MIQEIPIDEVQDKAINWYGLFWRKEVKVVGKIESVENPGGNERRVIFESFSGPEKGKRFRARFDASQPVKVFDEDSLVMALLEV
jgi:hypothetical protein